MFNEYFVIINKMYLLIQAIFTGKKLQMTPIGFLNGSATFFHVSSTDGGVNFRLFITNDKWRSGIFLDQYPVQCNFEPDYKGFFFDDNIEFVAFWIQ